MSSPFPFRQYEGEHAFEVASREDVLRQESFAVFVYSVLISRYMYGDMRAVEGTNNVVKPGRVLGGGGNAIRNRI